MINSIKEETGQLLHNRMLIIVLFIIPIAANLLIGWVFQCNVISHIPTAIVDYDQSSLSRMIIQHFSENDTFSVNYMLQDEETLKQLIEEGKVKVGMVIPENFSKDVTMLRSPNVLMIYDGSSMPVASTAKAKASEILLTLKTGAAMKVIGGKLSMPGDVARKTALSIGFKNRFMYNPAKSYTYSLNPGLGAATVQSAIVLMGVVCIRKEKLKEGLRRNLGYIAGKIVFYGILGAASLVFSVLIQHFIFAVPMKGAVTSVLILCLFMAVAEAACAVMLSVWIHEKMFALLVAAVLFIPSTALGGYTWPRLAMPEFYKSLAYILPFAHYGNSLRDLLLKGITLGNLVPELKWFAGYTAVCFTLAGLGVLAWNLPLLTGNPVLTREGKVNEVF